MRKKQMHPMKKKVSKQYTREKMLQAYNAVKEEHLPVDKAARLYGVPAQTLRDRVLNKVKINAKWGSDSLFSEAEEELLVSHLESLAQVGYGINRSQLNILASDLATKLGKRQQGKSVSDTWYYAFLKRWDHKLKLIKPRALSSIRAAAVTQESIDDYYRDLNNILDKYNLKSKPHLIYNMDETGLQPEHKMGKVIAGKSASKTQAITSPNAATTTLMGCVNAAGTALPPYYVFKGKRRNDQFLKNAVQGSEYQMSDSGWSNTEVLMKYLDEHFLKYVQRGSVGNDEPILLLYDGHTSHGSIDIIKWARQNNIILFVLPPHSSHVLQPLDIGCFGPFKSIYYRECNLYMSKERGRVIRKYEIAEISGKAYLKLMTPMNIQSAFRKAGIAPFDDKKVPLEMIMPSKSFPPKQKQEIKDPNLTMEELLKQKMEESEPKANIKQDKKDESEVKPCIKRPKLGGKAITEDEIFIEIEKYENERTERKKVVSTKQQPKSKYKNGKEGKRSGKNSQRKCSSPKPSTSGTAVNRKLIFIEDSCDSDSELDDDDGEKCCVCEKFSPPGLKDCVDVVIVKWAQCTKCSHWCHLRFCSETRVVRRLADFFCPHCV